MMGCFAEASYGSRASIGMDAPWRYLVRDWSGQDARDRNRPRHSEKINMTNSRLEASVIQADPSILLCKLMDF
jgi:hypothetical protein